ncbi:MAG: nitrophenyl compound nitroreductase subunit ArsF family protein [Bacteroidales bacterium]|nr:nitrophenyl compound nitroreductase subunit ArsF family protein [Bacteroidales bacterium]MDD3859700.1 nitrophenyl compound nitroreductase subunit ArsF family protein [Bacteroidales bacterium]
MKKIILIISALAMIFSIQSCKNSNNNKEESVEFKEKITIAYFHGERRCKTCVAVGDVAKLTYEENYKNNKDIAFKEINIDEKANAGIAEKYEIAGSALLIIVDGKAEDITGMAFQNALSNPNVLEEKIIEIVNSGL